MTKTACPTCGRALFSPNPTDPIPTRNDPYILPTLPSRFRLPGSNVPVQIVSITDDDTTATTTITVRQLLS